MRSVVRLAGRSFSAKACARVVRKQWLGSRVFGIKRGDGPAFERLLATAPLDHERFLRAS